MSDTLTLFIVVFAAMSFVVLLIDLIVSLIDFLNKKNN